MSDTVRLRVRNVMDGTFAEVNLYLDGEPSQRFLLEGKVYEAQVIEDVARPKEDEIEQR